MIRRKGIFQVRSNQTVLFIGDSITDMGRRTTDRPFGTGYVSLFIELQRAIFPERTIRYLNTGIGGNTVLDLLGRWSDDVIREQPEWLSVMIGINDCHRFLQGGTEHAPSEFRKNYETLLATTRNKVRSELILIDPFYVSTDRKGLGERTHVLKLLPQYIAVVHDLARKYRARLVCTHDMFQRHLRYTTPDFFCPEPIHPYRSGHLVIALALMELLGRKH